MRGRSHIVEHRCPAFAARPQEPLPPRTWMAAWRVTTVRLHAAAGEDSAEVRTLQRTNGSNRHSHCAPMLHAARAYAGFDPLRLGTNPDRLKWYREAELYNGRCACACIK